MQGLGQQLSAARTARNLTVDDVAAQIHLRPEYIVALEEERFGDIGDPLYVRGFLRTYSHFLDLSAERLIGEYRATAPEGIKLLGAQTPEELAAEAKRTGARSTALLAGVAALIVTGGGLLAVFAHAKQPAAKPASGVAAVRRQAAARATELPLEARKVAEDEPAAVEPTTAPERSAPPARRTAAPQPVSATPASPAAIERRTEALATIAPAPRPLAVATTSVRTPVPAPTSPIRRIQLPPVEVPTPPSAAPLVRAPIGMGSPTVWETPAQTARRAEINL